MSKFIDFTSMAGGIGAAFSSSLDLAKGVGLFSGTFAPQTKELLEADLKRFESNFREKGLNNIEEIPAGGTLTRYVFLPKGPIYGDYAYDPATANDLPLSTEEGRSILPSTSPGSHKFGRLALQPTYIFNIRREEVYVEGKRILSSDPLSSTGAQ